MAVRPRRRRRWAKDRVATTSCVHPRRDLFTIERNPLARGTNHDGRRESGRKGTGGRGAEQKIFVYCTIEFLFSQPIKAICREICSQIHVVTRPSLCIKVVAL
jgi:hypothetical protein